MKGRVQDYCKVGLVHFMMWKDCIKGDGDHGSVDIVLKDPYFDAIEMTWVNDAARRLALSEKIRASGKFLGFGAQPVLLTQKLDLNHLDETERRRAVDAVLGVIPQACELGAKGFALLSGKAVDPENKNEALLRCVRSLKEIAAALKEQSNLPLILETFDQLSYGKNCLIGSHIDAAFVAREMRKEFPDFGLMLDLSHLPLQGETPSQAWTEAGEFVTHAHIGNCVMEKPGHPMNGDEHPPFCDPDGQNGVDELAEYLRILLAGGYLDKTRRPVLSFEVCVYGSWSQEGAIQHCKDTLDAAWAKV